MTDRDNQIIEDYRRGLTMKECGAKYGLSKGRVHQIIQKHSPQSARVPWLMNRMIWNARNKPGA